MKVDAPMDPHEHMCFEGLIKIAQAAGLLRPQDPVSTGTMLDKFVPAIVRHLEGADPMLDLTRRRDNPTADMLAADLQALRAEMKKPMGALSHIHKMALGTGADGSSRARERLGRVCLWALLGDDDYLTDAADRLALLGPDAAGPASGALPPPPS